jgi:hypothetical protein
MRIVNWLCNGPNGASATAHLGAWMWEATMGFVVRE